MGGKWRDRGEKERRLEGQGSEKKVNGGCACLRGKDRGEKN